MRLVLCVSSIKRNGTAWACTLTASRTKNQNVTSENLPYTSRGREDLSLGTAQPQAQQSVRATTAGWTTSHAYTVSSLRTPIASCARLRNVICSKPANATAQLTPTALHADKPPPATRICAARVREAKAEGTRVRSRGRRERGGGSRCRRIHAQLSLYSETVNTPAG